MGAASTSSAHTTGTVEIMHFRQTLAFALVAIAAIGAYAQEPSPQASKPGCANANRPPRCKCTRPQYPVEAARRGEQGTTKVRITIAPDGFVSEVELLQSSGSTTLDQATFEHFKDVCFKPARDSSGNAVSASTTVEYKWRLE